MIDAIIFGMALLAYFGGRDGAALFTGTDGGEANASILGVSAVPAGLSRGMARRGGGVPRGGRAAEVRTRTLRRNRGPDRNDACRGIRWHGHGAIGQRAGDTARVDMGTFERNMKALSDYLKLSKGR